MIRVTIEQMERRECGFSMDVEVRNAGDIHPRLLRAATFASGSRGDNFRRAFRMAASEMAKAIADVSGVVVEVGDAVPVPAPPAPAVTLADLEAALVRHGVIQADAIADATGFDEGRTREAVLRVFEDITKRVAPIRT